MEAVFQNIPLFFEGGGRPCVVMIPFSQGGKVLKIIRASLAFRYVGSAPPPIVVASPPTRRSSLVTH